MKIIKGNKQELSNPTKTEILEAVKENGIIILRDFNLSVEKFSDFIGNICSKVTNDPARTASAKNTQLIESGDMTMGLHLENGNAPFMPDFQFFYCAVAPTNLSRTTYCDGVEAYQKLDKTYAQELFNREIMYTRNINDSLWKKYFSTELQQDINRIKDVLPYLPNYVEIREKDANNIQWRVRRKVVFDSPLSKKRVLAHCIYGPSINYDIAHTTWSDGSMIRPSILNAISEICDELTKPIPYASGDVVILDNHRIMHGREPILDTNRKIYGGQGYL